MFRFLIAVSVLTFSFVAFPAALTVVGSKANAASVEELITSLEGYLCVDPETSEAVTLLFHEVNGATTLLPIGDPIFSSADVEETRNGYRITPIGGFPGFLSEIDNHWKLFVATPEGTFTIDCQDLGTLPQMITQALYELLDENVAQDHRTAVQKIREAELRVDAANQELREANLVISRLRDELLEANERLGAMEESNLPVRPPLSRSEEEGLRVQIQRCWGVGTLSPEAIRTVVVVAVEMGRDAKPIQSSIRLVGSEGGSDAAVNEAFEAARRAIIRCGLQGYELDELKLPRLVELTFDLERMRIR